MADKKQKGNKIRLYRSRAGLNQAEFGRLVGVKQQTTSAYERNEIEPRVKEITAMLNIFESITYDELFNTGKFSIYISESIEKILEECVEDLKDLFPATLTKYEKKAIIANLILRNGINKNLDIEELRKHISDIF